MDQAGTDADMAGPPRASGPTAPARPGWLIPVVALSAAALVFAGAYLVLHFSSHSECVRAFASLDGAPSTDGQELEDCPADDRIEGLLAIGVDSVPSNENERLEEATGIRALLITWMAISAAAVALLAATAIYAALGARAQRSELDEFFKKVTATPSGWDRVEWLAPLLLVLAIGLYVVFALQQRISIYDGMHNKAFVALWVMYGMTALGVVFALAWSRQVLRQRAGWPLELLHQIGRYHSRVMILLGAALSVGILSTASRWRLIGALPGGRELPSTALLVFGAIFALGAAAVTAGPLQAWLLRVEEAAQSAVEGDPYSVGRETDLDELRRSVSGAGGLRAMFSGAVGVAAPFLVAIADSLVT